MGLGLLCLFSLVGNLSFVVFFLCLVVLVRVCWVVGGRVGLIGLVIVVFCRMFCFDIGEGDCLLRGYDDIIWFCIVLSGVLFN